MPSRDVSAERPSLPCATPWCYSCANESLDPSSVSSIVKAQASAAYGRVLHGTERQRARGRPDGRSLPLGPARVRGAADRRNGADLCTGGREKWAANSLRRRQFRLSRAPWRPGAAPIGRPRPGAVPPSARGAGTQPVGQPRRRGAPEPHHTRRGPRCPMSYILV
jgi:hypothetical protein